MLPRFWNQNMTHLLSEWQGHLLSCPGQLKRWVTHSLTYIHTTCNQEMPAHIKMVLLYWKECWIFWSDCNLEKKIISADPYDWMVGKVWKSGRKTGFSSLITDLIRRWIMHTPAGQGGAKLPSNLQIEFFSSYHPLIQKIFPHTTLPKRRSARIRPLKSTGWLHVDNIVLQSEPCLHGSYPHHSVPSTGAINPANDSF